MHILGGVGIWINNFEFLSQHYTVHAIDLLGWGLSSRPKLTLPLVANNSTTSTSSPSFSSSESHASHAQEWWVSSIEQWRKRMGIDKFTLVGHSMGGFIAASYAMKHGSQLDKLVLLSPIGLNGFSVPPPTTHRTRLRNFVINSIWNITPQRLISFMSADRVRQMILRSRNHVAKSFQTDGDTVVEYVFLLATTGR